jgi:hypothetical protein
MDDRCRICDTDGFFWFINDEQNEENKLRIAVTPKAHKSKNNSHLGSCINDIGRVRDY